MATLAELMVSVGADISGFQQKMQTVQNTMKNVSKNMKSNGDKMAKTGSTLTKSIAVPLAGIAVSAVTMSSRYEAQMSIVKAVTGTTGKEFKSLKGLARDMGKTTQFSAIEAAEGIEFLARAGWDNTQIMKGLPSVLNLAKSSAMDLGSASDITSNIMSGFGAKASEAGRYVDVLALTSASANTDTAQLGEAMKHVAPIANTMGMSVEDTATAIAFMSDAGIQGSQAGTSLRTSLNKLADPSTEAKKVMDDLSMSFFNQKGEMKDLPGIIKTLEGGMEGLTDKQKAQAMSSLVGMEASSGLAVMLGRGSGEAETFSNKLSKAEGTANRMAETVGNNLNGKLKELWSQLSDVAIELGQSLTPYVEKAVGFFSKLTEKVAGMSNKTKATITIVAGLVAGLAPLLAVVGFAISGIGTLVGVLGAISLPVVAVIAVIALFGVAMVALWKKSETFRDIVKSVFEAVKAKVEQAIGAVTKFLKSKLSQIQKFWEENGTQILEAVESAFNKIKAVIDFVMPAVLGVIKFIWNAIKGVIDGALNVIMGAIKIFTGVFTGDFSKMWSGVKQLFKGAVQLIWNLMSLSFVGAIRKLVMSFGKGIVRNIKGMWDTIRLKFMYGKDKAVGLMNAMKTKGLNAFSTMKDRVKGIFESIKGFIVNPIRTAKNKISGFIDTIKGLFSNLSLTIPKPKFPKISISKGTKSFFGASVPFPKFNVNWNAKGGIYNGASILGGGQGVGEAGAEAVLPIQHKRYMAPFASAVADHLPDKEESGGGVVESHVTTIVQLDGKEVGRTVERHVSEQQYARQKRTNRTR